MYIRTYIYIYIYELVCILYTYMIGRVTRTLTCMNTVEDCFTVATPQASSCQERTEQRIQSFMR